MEKKNRSLLKGFLATATALFTTSGSANPQPMPHSHKTAKHHINQLKADPGQLKTLTKTLNDQYTSAYDTNLPPHEAIGEDSKELHAAFDLIFHSVVKNVPGLQNLPSTPRFYICDSTALKMDVYGGGLGDFGDNTAIVVSPAFLELPQEEQKSALTLAVSRLLIYSNPGLEKFYSHPDTPAAFKDFNTRPDTTQTHDYYARELSIIRLAVHLPGFTPKAFDDYTDKVAKDWKASGADPRLLGIPSFGVQKETARDEDIRQHGQAASKPHTAPIMTPGKHTDIGSPYYQEAPQQNDQPGAWSNMDTDEATLAADTHAGKLDSNRTGKSPKSIV